MAITSAHRHASQDGGERLGESVELADSQERMASSATSAKPVYDLEQIETALTTNWSGDRAGHALTWLFMGNQVTYELGSSFGTGFNNRAAMTREAFELWDDLIDNSLAEVASGGNIVVNYAPGGGSFTSNQTEGDPAPHYRLAHSEITLDSSWHTNDDDSDVVYGRYGFLTTLHEIGHALGLSHPGPYNDGDVPPPTYENAAVYAQDTLAYTTMSYFEANADGSGTDHTGDTGAFDVGEGQAFERDYASTPLLHDIYAIQRKYGADMTTRTGDTVYGFNSTAGRDVFDFNINVDPVIAIWDAGGNDTLDFSGFSRNTTLDLTPGSYSSTGDLTNNVAIAYNVTIEHAIGGSGSDTIIGNGASNTIFGGFGHDAIVGMDGSDTIHGGSGNDALYADHPAGSQPNSIGDTLFGESGDDDLLGSNGSDTLSGGANDDTLTGAGGDDYLMGGTGDDYVDGGAGIGDWVRYSEATGAVDVDLAENRATGADGTDQVYLVENIEGSNFDDTLRGDGNANQLLALDGEDVLIGGNGDDFLFGGAENDRLQGGVGQDRLYGEGGAGDWALYADARQQLGNGVKVDLTTGLSYYGILGILGFAWAVEDEIYTIENIEGSQYRDLLIGNGFANHIVGGAGDDELVGAEGADTLDGGTDSDTASYAASNAAVTVNLRTGTGQGGHAEGDTLINVENLAGSRFADTLTGDDQSNRLEGGFGEDSLDGGNGADWITYEDGRLSVDFDVWGVKVDLAAGVSHDGIHSTFEGLYWKQEDDIANIENAEGTAYLDILIGNDAANELHGLAGNDTLSGGAGHDILIGGEGDDVLDGGNGNDTLEGGIGEDDLDGGDGSDWITYVNRLSFDFDVWGVRVDLASGRTDNGAHDTFSGLYWVEEDTLAGIEHVEGTRYRDVLIGDAGANQLVGHGGDDALEGGGGADVLRGGIGNDVLSGGGGNDTAVLSGARANYRIEISLDGRYRSVDLRDGSSDGADLLHSIESLSFSDGVVDAQSARFNALYNMPGWHSLAGDFNGDGTSDLLWNSGSQTGVLGTWLMGDGAIRQTIALNHNMPGWHALAGDFNGDGTDDLLWNSGTETGILGTWLMGNGAIQQTIALNHDMPGWHALAGDFNGDGTDDLLWNSGSETGVLGVWLMDGGRIGATIALNHDMPGWDVAAVGDFNNDGTDDLLWRNAQGASGAWLMRDGFIFATFGAGSTAGYDAVGQGDFDGNGTTDILWQQAGGDVSTWMLA